MRIVQVMKTSLEWRLMATNTSRLEESDFLNKLSQQVDTRIQEGLAQLLTQLEDRLETAIECLHETIANSIGTRSQHSGGTQGEYICSNSQTASVDKATYATALSCNPNYDIATGQSTSQNVNEFSRNSSYTPA